MIKSLLGPNNFRAKQTVVRTLKYLIMGACTYIWTCEWCVNESEMSERKSRNQNYYVIGFFFFFFFVFFFFFFFS